MTRIRRLRDIDMPRNWTAARVAVDTYGGLLDAATWKERVTGYQVTLRQVAYQDRWFEFHSTQMNPQGQMMQSGPLPKVLNALRRHVAFIDGCAVQRRSDFDRWKITVEGDDGELPQLRAVDTHRSQEWFIVLRPDGRYDVAADVPMQTGWGELLTLIQYLERKGAQTQQEAS